MSKKSHARGSDWTPAPSVSFSPVPFKLLRVAEGREAGAEFVAAGSIFKPDEPREPFGEYSGVKFDPWRKGDVVVVEVVHRSYALRGPTTAHSTFHVMYRATTPSAAKHIYTNDPAGDLDNGFIRADSSSVTLWRIAYRWRQAATRVIGIEFESREALEAALESPPVALPLAA